MYRNNSIPPLRADLSSSNGSYSTDQDLNTTCNEVLRSSSASHFHLGKVKMYKRYFWLLSVKKLVLNWNNLENNGGDGKTKFLRSAE